MGGIHFHQHHHGSDAGDGDAPGASKPAAAPLVDMADIFISYAKEDKAVAADLAKALENRGWSVWWDRKIPPGKTFSQVIEAAIEAAKCVVVLWSKESIKSDWVQNEASEGTGRNILVPALIDNVKIPFEFRRIQAADLTDWKPESTHDGFTILLDSISKIVEPAVDAAAASQTAVEQAVLLPPEPQPYRIAADFYPGGAVEADCPFYIQRQADDEVMAGVCRHRGLVTIQGPSQSGKTSMMLRLYSQVRTSQFQLRPVIVDLQSLPEACFESLPAIWQAILVEVDAQLDLGALEEQPWSASVAYDRNLNNYLELNVFANDATPVLICLDEVNRIFGMPVRSEFFSSLRSFYNRGAYDPTWKKLRWLLSTSSEPRFFIDDLNESPFNVGAKVPLGAFTFEETAEFVRRYGFSPDTKRVERMMTCLGGRPYLVHLLLHHMAQQPEQEAALLDAASAGAGVYKPHLDHYLARFQEQADLSAAIKRVIAGKGCADVRMADRLAAAGLVTEDAEANIVCACELYATYFGRRL
jgi:hypothetical protein